MTPTESATQTAPATPLESRVTIPPARFDLNGRKGLVLGIANDQSIAWGCARAMRSLGADIAVTYLNDRAEPYVRPLAEALGSPLICRCDVEQPDEVDAVFDAVRATWGRLDFVLHSIAYAPKDDLHGRVVDCSAAGFARAMDVSCHSFIRLARLAEPLMTDGGTLLATSFLGGQKVVSHYNLMGPVKAALEAVVRELAVELGPQGIRVHALSPGPIATRAASGIDHFDELLADADARSSQRQRVTIDDVGRVAAGLVSDWSRGMTGNVVFIDGGTHVLG
jgi:enoyl-[acyl-carrier protein] reductase I